MEAQAAEAAKEGDVDLASQLVSDFMARSFEEARIRAEELCARIR